jgi:hypothetical protein
LSTALDRCTLADVRFIALIVALSVLAFVATFGLMSYLTSEPHPNGPRVCGADYIPPKPAGWTGCAEFG